MDEVGAEAGMVVAGGEDGPDGGRSGRGGGGVRSVAAEGAEDEGVEPLEPGGAPPTACCIRQWILNQLDLLPYLEPDLDIPTIRHFLNLHALHAVRFFLLMTHL